MFSLYQHFCWRAFCKPFAFVLAARRGLSPSHLAGSAPPFPLVTAKGKPAAELSTRVCSNPSDAQRCHQKGKVCDKWLGAPVTSCHGLRCQNLLLQIFSHPMEGIS